MEDVREQVFRRISKERDRQTEKWPGQWKPGCITPGQKLAILTEEIGEISRELCESGMSETEHLRKELTQAAAVCVAWLESMEPPEAPQDFRDTLPATRKQLNYLEAYLENSFAEFGGGVRGWEEWTGTRLSELTRDGASKLIDHYGGKAS